MNRLVIIGNGFDLAHGLPTSYKDFIDDFWKNIKNSNHNELVAFNLGSYVEFNGHENLTDLIDLIVHINGDFRKEGIGIYKLKDFLRPLMDNRIQILQYKNQLFKLINQSAIENWVDVENEYYKELKNIAKSKLISIEDKKRYAIILNKEFEEVKNLLENYLSKTFDAIYNFEDILKLEIIDHLKANPNCQDFLFEKEDRSFYNKTENLELGNTLLLSFNYTKTVIDYSNYLLEKGLGIGYDYIHGKIMVKELPIIFGFGDEMDDDYKEIENIDDNEYLKYFKSIQYLEHSTYKRLYNFIEEEPFQVFVFGHSCGLSDRTLLSTIFENDNCFSVKVFYYERENGSDNYTELIQNISRHFSDKKMLRKKVVEKRHCKPLLKLQPSLK